MPVPESWSHPMRLFLSSYLLGSEPHRILDLLPNPDHRKALIIMNAADLYEPEVRAEILGLQIAGFAELGIEATELDLRDHFTNTDRIHDLINKTDLIWTVGGNTFVLRRAMKLSGFDQILKAALTADKVAYGGFSAGAVVTTPNLKGTEIVDDAHTVPENYGAEAKNIIWEGLNIYSTAIAPHFESTYEDAGDTQAVINYFEAHKMPYLALRDGEALIINGSENVFIEALPVEPVK